MIVIVLDTNVLVSALLSASGPAARILELVLAGELMVAYEDRILAEYRQVLARPRFGFDPQDVEEILSALETTGLATLVQPSPAVLNDPTDQAFLEVALTLGVPLVTGNLRHFPASVCAPARVFSPAEFLAWWQARCERG